MKIVITFTKPVEGIYYFYNLNNSYGGGGQWIRRNIKYLLAY